MKKRALFFLASILCTLPLLIPLFANGMLVSEDGPAHLVRQEAFTHAVLRGEILPRWVPELNFGFGSPLFLYNWILPYYAGAFIQIVFQTTALVALKWTLALGVVLTAFTTFLWLHRRFGHLAGFLGAVTITWVPYRVLTIYERATPGELWLTLFPPLILWLVDRNDRWSRIFLPLAWAGMFLTHNVGSLMFTPVILFLIAITKADAASRDPDGGRSDRGGFVSGARTPAGCEAAGPAILALLITSFNWIPGMFESPVATNVGANLIASSSLIHTNIAAATLQEWIARPVDALTVGPRALAVGFTIPLIGLMSLIRRMRNKHGKHEFLMLYVALFASFFLMSPWASWFWQHVPLMNTILYPWRLANIVILVSSALAAWWLVSLPVHTRRVIAGMLIVLAVVGTVPSLRVKPQFVPLKKNWLETTWPDVVGEYLPKGITYNTLGELSSSITKNTRGKIVRGERWVGLNQLWFPGWKAKASNIDLFIRHDFPGREGLLTVEVPSSTDVRFSFTHTPLQFLSVILSFLGIVIWLWQVGRVGQMRRRLPSS